MAGQSSLVATAEQKAALQALSQSDVRGEADRARAILLTLQGWTSPQVAQAFDVAADAVRHWRGWFSERGVDALRSTLAPGPSSAKGEHGVVQNRVIGEAGLALSGEMMAPSCFQWWCEYGSMRWCGGEAARERP